MLIKHSVVYYKNFVWLNVLFLCLYVSGSSAQISPCPDVFSYVYDNDNSIIGRVVVPSPSFGVHKLSITMSVRALLQSNYVGKISLLNKEDLQQILQNGGNLNYKVSFATQNPLPVITSITFSGRQLCSGSVDQNLGPGEYLTSLELHHTLRAELSQTNVPYANIGSIPSQTFNSRQPVQNNFVAPATAVQNSVPSYDFGNNNNYNSHQTTITTKSPVVYDTNIYGQNGGGNQYPQKVNNNQYTTEQSTKQPDPYWSYTSSTRAPSWNTPSTTAWTSAGKTTTFRQWTTPRRTTTTTQAPSRNSDTEDNEICGVSSIQTINLIFYGETTSHGEWPWIVAIFQKKQSGINYICTGSLVSNTAIVTAAHCTFDKPRGGKKVRADTLLLRIGVHNIQNWEDEYGKIRGVRDIIYPPEFTESEPTDVDLAILVMSNPIQYSRYIKPVCLWSGANIQGGLNASVVGWGRDEIQNIAVPEPRRTIVPLVTQEQCKNSNIAFRFLLNEHKFCAGNRDGSGPCNGDSGGGLYVYRNNHFELKGIVSTSLSDPGTGSCDLSHYVLYADAGKLAGWLRIMLQTT